MQPSKTPRIVLNNLPPLEALSPEEAAQIFGAGRAHLGVERLEGRDLMAANLTASLAPPQSREVVFIDPGVRDYQKLLAGPVAAEVVVLRPDGDGVRQIAAALQGRTGVEALHIVSHGEAGAVFLGSSVLDGRAAAGQDAEALHAIGRALAPGADVNLYGCDVAQGQAGHAFIAELAKQTGADVAASTNRTGSAAQGGDWRLEAATGHIEHQAPFSAAALAVYDHTLGLPAAVTAKWNVLGGSKGGLGAYNDLGYMSLASGVNVYGFAHGSIFHWTKTGQTAAVYGAIGARYWASETDKDAFGKSVRTILGLPTGDEQDVPGVKGARVSHFQGGDVYWSATTGAHVVYGAIGQKYQAAASMKDAYGNSVKGVLGLPTSDEVVTPNGGRVSHFQGGDIYWSSATGAHVVYGAILARYKQLGGPGSALGLPTSDELATPAGRINHFQGGDITWSKSGGAKEIYRLKVLALVKSTSTGLALQADPVDLAKNVMTGPGGDGGKFAGGFGDDNGGPSNNAVYSGAMAAIDAVWPKYYNRNDVPYLDDQGNFRIYNAATGQFDTVGTVQDFIRDLKRLAETAVPSCTGRETPLQQLAHQINPTSFVVREGNIALIIPA